MSPSILLVDDDLDQLTVLGAMLSSIPYALNTALNAKRALEMVQAEAPSLIITDMVMPDMSGSEFLRAVRSDPRLSDTKLIVMTSQQKYVSIEDREMADAVVIKPLKQEELDAALEHTLGSKAAPKD